MDRPAPHNPACLGQVLHKAKAHGLDDVEQRGDRLAVQAGKTRVAQHAHERVDGHGGVVVLGAGHQVDSRQQVQGLVTGGECAEIGGVGLLGLRPHALLLQLALALELRQVELVDVRVQGAHDAQHLRSRAEASVRRQGAETAGPRCLARAAPCMQGMTARRHLLPGLTFMTSRFTIRPPSFSMRSRMPSSWGNMRYGSDTQPVFSTTCPSVFTWVALGLGNAGC